MTDTQTSHLPKDFLERMQDMLGAEFDDFLQSFSQNHSHSGIRINNLKKGALEAVMKETGKLSGVPWCADGWP